MLSMLKFNKFYKDFQNIGEKGFDTNLPPYFYIKLKIKIIKLSHQ